MTMLSRTCECGPRRLRDGDRCAKCGKSLPPTRRPLPSLLDYSMRGSGPSDADVDNYERLLDEAEPIVDQLERDGLL